MCSDIIAYNIPLDQIVSSPFLAKQENHHSFDVFINDHNYTFLINQSKISIILMFVKITT